MKRVLSFLLICSSLSVSAQYAESWTDITLYRNLNEKLTLYGDGGPRFVLHKNSPYGFYIRPCVAFKPSNIFTVNGGIAWFYVNDTNDLHEFRGWQGFRFDWKLGRVIVSNFNRLEERWFFQNDEKNFLLRLRMFAGLTIPINHQALIENTWYVPVAFEIFEDLNDHETFVNRDRIYAGLGYVLNSKARFEVFYIANESRANPEEAFTMANVIRVRLHFTLGKELKDQK